jgi:DNA-binding PadR family transcriptional regulator
MSPRPSLPLRLEYVLLGLIRRRPVHGYELLARWNEAGGIGLVWRVKPGRFYAALDKLEHMEYLSLTLVAGDAFPLRKEYRITAAGEQAFLDWMRTPVPAARELRQDFVAKLYFATDVDPRVMEELFSRQLSACRRWLDAVQEELPSAIGFERQVLTFRVRQLQFVREWLQDSAPAASAIPARRIP